jgi:hypothetical protein
MGSSNASGKLIMLTALNGQRLVHIPHPEQSSSEMIGFFVLGLMVMVSSSMRTPGQYSMQV